MSKSDFREIFVEMDTNQQANYIVDVFARSHLPALPAFDRLILILHICTDYYYSNQKDPSRFPFLRWSLWHFDVIRVPHRQWINFLISNCMRWESCRENICRSQISNQNEFSYFYFELSLLLHNDFGRMSFRRRSILHFPSVKLFKSQIDILQRTSMHIANISENSCRGRRRCEKCAWIVGRKWSQWGWTAA